MTVEQSSKTRRNNNDSNNNDENRNDNDEHQQQQQHEPQDTNDVTLQQQQHQQQQQQQQQQQAEITVTATTTKATNSIPNDDCQYGSIHDNNDATGISDDIIINHHHIPTSSPITQQQPQRLPQQQPQTAIPLETSSSLQPIPPIQPKPIIKLIKSTRLKGYMTLTLAAFINFDAARTSSNIDRNAITIVPSTDPQRLYAQITAIISLIGTTICCLIHFDRITPLQNKLWIPIFFHTNGTSLYEGGMILFYTLWWSIATGIATSVNGIAGDGKGQYSLYYSTWACCLTSFWLLERWFVASGWSSFNSFITSWPNRSPAWICIMLLSFFTLIWYLDLWQNHNKLSRDSEEFIIRHFEGVNERQWQWLMTVSVCTFCPAVFFVAVELFRETKSDGSIAVKSSVEALIEGIWFVGLTFAWIATVMIATTPRGAASLIGNSYFFTWVMSIFVFEGFIWYIHDRRKATYQALKEKQDEYRQRQEQVLQQAKEIQRKYEEREDFGLTPMNQDSDPSVNRGPLPSRRGFSHEFLDSGIGQQNVSRRRC